MASLIGAILCVGAMLIGTGVAALPVFHAVEYILGFAPNPLGSKDVTEAIAGMALIFVGYIIALSRKYYSKS
jgi:hypothetical protein